MLLHAYLPKLITALFGGLFIAAGVLTFGNALVFDRLYIGILIFTAIVCRKDINVVGIIVILLIERITEELLWYSFVDHFYNVPYLKILIYLALCLIVYKLWFDAMAKIALPCLVLSICSEFYWYFADYQRIPAIYWYNIIIGINLFTRYMLFSRIEFTELFVKTTVLSINLDWAVYQITRIYIVVEALNILEYLTRHITKISQLQVIYYVYPFILHAAATFTLWIVFNETNKILKNKLMKA